MGLEELMGLAREGASLNKGLELLVPSHLETPSWKFLNPFESCLFGTVCGTLALVHYTFINVI